MLEQSSTTRAMEFIPQLAEPAVRLHLLVVDADAAVRSACAEIAASLGYAVESTGDLGQARSLLRGHAADILLVNLPAGSNQGLELVSEVKLLYSDTSVIAMTASGSVNAAVEAMRCGASDYLTKPFAMDELSTVLDRAAQSHMTDTATRQLRERLRLSQGLGAMIGRSPEMEKLYRILSKVAQSTHPVLILGESGTGKELVARTIHAYGPNSQKPFLPVDCGSLVPTLIESELFGYVKGAFTGANRSKDGLLVSAEGGTVFLDEIGELSLDLQAKLLRALAGEGGAAGGRHPSRAHQGAHRGRHQPRSGGDGRKGHLPQGSLLPAQRGQPAAALAARPPRGHSASGRALSRPHQPRARPQVHPERRGPAHHDAPRLAGQRAGARKLDRAGLRAVFRAGAAPGRSAHAVAAAGAGSAARGRGLPGKSRERRSRPR